MAGDTLVETVTATRAGFDLPHFAHQSRADAADDARTEDDVAYDREVVINAQLQERIASLLQESAEKDDVLGLISHEIRTPLAIIIGNVDALQTGRFADADSQSAALNDIAASARRVVGMAANMLALVRHERESPELEPLLLQRCLAAIAVEHLQLHPGTELRVLVPSDLAPVLGISSYIEQIVGNLLSNASKYGTRGEPIEVAAERHGHLVSVTVTTAGALMEPDNIDRLFAPFHREAAGRLLGPGLGLGLAVCRLLVTAQEGTIHAFARPDGGLSVTFTLAVAED